MTFVLYHGTDYNAAISIQSGEFRPKPNPYHWLGNGIYFYIDRALAEWWTTNPTEKFGCNVEHPALVMAKVEVEEDEILDLRRFEIYVRLAEEFERFFTQIYIPYHRETISEMQIKCLFFDWYFLAHPKIKIIIGDFYSFEQPYFSKNECDFYEHTKLSFGETQVCLKKECQDIIIKKEVIDLCPKSQ
jgi:hypothetical protein